MTYSEHDDAQLLASPLSLPCGRVVPNRLVKAAMYEHLTDFHGGPPNHLHHSLYQIWASGGWGMLITGNVQVSSKHLSLGRDLVSPAKSASPEALRPWRQLASAMHSVSTGAQAPLAVVQLSHAGRQSPRIIGGRGPFTSALAPSAKRVGSDSPEGWIAKVAYYLLFNSVKAMSVPEIREVVDAFVLAANNAVEAGFDGVQLHASHGYLLSQFGSPKTNLRVDEYSNNLALLKEVATAVRTGVPTSFILGIKLNAGDYVKGGLSEDQALEQVREIGRWEMIDFIEVSGGDYENPVSIIQEFAKRGSSRQAFFSRFARQAMDALPLSPKSPVIMLTGSLRTRAQFATSVRNKHAHLIGLARPSVLCPALPQLVLSEKSDEVMPDLVGPTLISPSWVPKLINASTETAWYAYGIRSLALGRNVDVRTTLLYPLLNMYFLELGILVLLILTFVAIVLYVRTN